MVLPLKWMPAYSHGGAFAAGQPTVVVVHCTESDNDPAMAEAIAGPGWFGGPKAGTSAHKVVDVDSICEGVKRTTVAYHAGPGGNVRGIAYEFCGRAGWSAAKWREPAQLQMLRNAAPHIADDLRAIAAAAGLSARDVARWLSLVQLGGRQRGLCTHNDIRLVFGGTTHSDPGPNFPYAELLAYVLAELGGTPTQEDDDMAFGDNERNLMQDTNNMVRGIFSLRLNEQIAALAATVAAQRDDVDEKAIADQVIAGLLPAVVTAIGQEAGLPEERIAEIVEQKVRGVFADAAQA